MFSYNALNRPESKTARTFRRVRQVAALVWTSDDVVWLNAAEGLTGGEVCLLRLYSKVHVDLLIAHRRNYL